MWQWFESVLKRKPETVEPPRKPSVEPEPVSLYGCLDDGTEHDYPPEDSVIKYLRD